MDDLGVALFLETPPTYHWLSDDLSKRPIPKLPTTKQLPGCRMNDWASICLYVLVNLGMASEVAVLIPFSHEIKYLGMEGPFRSSCKIW